jgi:hypothetical protein
MTIETTSQPVQPLSASPPTSLSAQTGQTRAAELREFLSGLLRFQRRITQAKTGIVYLVPGRARKGGVVVAQQGEDEDLPDPSLLQRLEAVAARAAAGTGTPIAEAFAYAEARDLYSAEPGFLALAVPLRAEGRVEGAAVLLTPRRGTDADDALSRLGLTVARFEAFLWRQSALAEAEQKVVLKETLELLDRAQQGTTARAMASLLCEELRRRFGCTRVSIGLLRGDRVRVLAISGSDDLDPHAPAVEAIEVAMEEAALQDAEVLFPSPALHENDPAARRVIHQHARLSEAFGPSAIVSLPLRLDGGLIGSVVLERDPSDPFPPAALSLLRLVAEFIGPALYHRRLADRRTLQVLRDDTADLAAAVVGPRHTAKKAVAALILGTLGLAAVVPIPARVAAPFELKAAVSRAIVPPFAGYLESSAVRPGDRVAPGDLLATMATDELRVQLAQAEANLQTLTVRLDNAMARGERAEARRTQAELDESQAAIDLLRHSLGSAQLRAPIAGVVSLGDLERLAGAPVDASQMLLEIVGDEAVAVIEVSEQDADRLRTGQTGWIAARGTPGQKIPVTVSRINPVAQVRDSGNVYLVEARVQAGRMGALRPGMTGSARLRAGWSTTLWEVARPLVDAARLRLWW